MKPFICFLSIVLLANLAKAQVALSSADSAMVSQEWLDDLWQKQYEFNVDLDWYMKHARAIHRKHFSIGGKHGGLGFGKFHPTYSGINFCFRSVYDEAMPQFMGHLDIRQQFMRRKFYRINNGLLVSGYSFGTSVNGLHIGGLLQGKKMNGVSATLVSNNCEKANGLMFSIANNECERINGILLSLFLNQSKIVNGLSMSLFNKINNLQGIVISPFLSSLGRLRGLNLSGFCRLRAMDGLSISLTHNSRKSENFKIYRNGYWAEPGYFHSWSYWRTSEKVNGVILSGLYTNELWVNGIAISGLVNKKINVKGIAIAGLANKELDGMNGLCIAGIYNSCYLSWNSAFNGLCIAGLYNNIEYMRGLCLSLGINSISRLDGMSVGLVNMVEGNWWMVNGVTIGAVNVLKYMNGLSIGGINYIEKLNGWSIGVVNNSERFNGVNVGLVNITGYESRGLQVGLINYRKKYKYSSGVGRGKGMYQIGLINIIANNTRHKILPFFNFSN